MTKSARLTKARPFYYKISSSRFCLKIGLFSCSAFCGANPFLRLLCSLSSEALRRKAVSVLIPFKLWSLFDLLSLLPPPFPFSPLHPSLLDTAFAWWLAKILPSLYSSPPIVFPEIVRWVAKAMPSFTFLDINYSK